MRSIVSSWRWWVCSLLLLATMVNYMDRLTLNLLSEPILRELNFSDKGYGFIESGFALAFAVGAIGFGFLVDRVGVYWVYPAAVLVWSAAGFCSGLATSFETMLLTRVLLGLAESANWPCALRVTQRILSREERSMGNSILQSGTAVGSIALPLLLKLLYVEGEPGAWRFPFFVVGAAGALWVVLWFTLLRREELDGPMLTPSVTREGSGDGTLPSLSAGRYIARFLALVVLVITTNMTWHFLRAWGPRFLQTQHDYTQDQVNNFFIGYYVLSDLGAIAAGALTLAVVAGGVGVHFSRMAVYLLFALIALLTAALPFLEGWLLTLTFLVVGFGALGVFPNYYSFTQDLTERHQGKLTGFLSSSCWVALAGWQAWIGSHIEATQSYFLPMIVAGIAPLVGFVSMILLWGPASDGEKLPEREPSARVAVFKSD
jgi:ACS family hexuronate transporter-like MFS transporter